MLHEWVRDDDHGIGFGNGLSVAAELTPDFGQSSADCSDIPHAPLERRPLLGYSHLLCLFCRDRLLVLDGDRFLLHAYNKYKGSLDHLLAKQKPESPENHSAQLLAASSVGRGRHSVRKLTLPRLVVEL